MIGLDRSEFIAGGFAAAIAVFWLGDAAWCGIRVLRRRWRGRA